MAIVQKQQRFSLYTSGLNSSVYVHMLYFANLVNQYAKEFVEEEIEVWEELDGYAHKLERRELFLVSLLEKGQLDAVVSYKTRIAADKIRPLLPAEDLFWSHYQKKGVYPINHIFVLQEEIFRRIPNIGEVLLSTFKESRKLWLDYLPNDKRGAMEAEMDKLNWDPFAYHLGEVEKNSLETFIDYLTKGENDSPEDFPGQTISCGVEG